MRIFLLFLLFIVSILNIIYVTQQWIWHPYDETAHYDYIAHLSTGQLPAANASLTQHTLSVSQIFGAVFTEEHNQLSYETQQPPIYYLALTLPKILMDTWAVPPPLQIQILRAFNPIFLLISALLLIKIFQHLQHHYQINVVYGYLLAVWLMFPGAIYWTGLNNNYLALVWNHWAILALLQYWQTKHAKSLFWAAIAVTLSFLTKYTNGYFVVLMGGVWLIALWQQRYHWTQIKALLLAATPLLAIIAYLSWNFWQYGDVLKTHETLGFFAAQIQSIGTIQYFIYLLSKSALNLEHLVILPNFIIWAGFILLCINTIAICLKFLFNKKQFLPLFIATILTWLIITSAITLNFNIEGVYWFNFRHYAGYSIFLYSLLFAMVWLPKFIQTYLVKFAILILTLCTSLLGYQLWNHFPPPYQLLVNTNQQCLTIHIHDEATNLSQLKTEPCTGAANQLWRYHPRFEFLQNKYNLCIDASIDLEWRKTEGHRLFVWQCVKSWNQKWISKDKQFAISEGQCLSRNTEQVPWIHLAPCVNQAIQQWQFKPISSIEIPTD